ncbi:heat shock protein, putative [Trichomonas vaginalis G3]|uniref:Heat shock protein, putative n=1 Tax=Trichomonas vaginalis (strain ATCC PRA-98 / G3) TaxID=412133 RepID=A2G493_TRIV3|nr:heat shock protein 70kDa family [Trichomonas vaginalis G3]EAX88021.1 heat shock protein, putative [Trichomonas vaginalis G3]KAI5551540.1 heat shock protein 70kDa family [Trichomonas vaginalis G3]|eukprot:XP_001300951.1 heat shock protein [Trichomonas vaginalis G3]
MFSFFLATLSFSKEEEDKDQGPVVGIDLGTTFSCVGIFQRGKVEIIANEVGNRITPSIVAYNDGQRYVGDSATSYLISNPSNTVYAVKRLIGRRFNDKEVQSEIGRLPYHVVEKDGRPYIDLEVKPGERRLVSPEEISAGVLTKMKNVAEDYLGRTVKAAVVTVPAYFNDAQRKATKDAGAIAGLDVKRIINEPTAAAIAYGLNKKDNQKILVFDLGGGTFDVSLLSIDDYFFEVLATAGDTHLGGEDFDNRVVDYFMDVFKRRTGKDASKDSKARAKLKREAEKAKRTLSYSHQTTIEIENFFDGEDLSETFNRARFEELNLDLFRKTMEPVQQVLTDSGLSKHEIDEIVLVGGSTRLPKIQQLVKDFFNGKQPCKSINPDEAVAYGAAVEGGIISDDPDTATITIINVNSLTLGIETMGGVMAELIPRNTRIPVKKTQTFTNAQDDQETVRIQVFEGERAMTRDNHFLGAFDLTGLPPGPRGSVQIDVTFELDQNNILKVTAEDKQSNNKETITIDPKDNRMTEEEIEKAIHDAEDNIVNDQQERESVQARLSLDSMIAAAKNNLNKDETKDRLSNEERRSLKRIIKEGEDWLQANPDEEAEVYNDKKKDLQQSLAPLLTDQKSKMNMDKNDDEDNDDDDDDDDVDDDEFGEI